MFRVRARSEVKFAARESVRVSLASEICGCSSVAEHNVANVDVAGSTPAIRSIFRCTFTLLTRVERTHIIDDARLAQLAKSSRLVSGRSSVRTRQRAPHFDVFTTAILWLSLCTGSATGSAAVSKTACWGFESLPVCHFHDDPFLAERQTRWAQNSVSQDIPVRIRGKGPTDRRGRSGKGKRDPKTLKRESRRGYAGNQPRHVVADAPNGYFSGSVARRESRLSPGVSKGPWPLSTKESEKRVSKPTLSSSNDRSSAMCRFESCRPHHGSLAQLAEHPALNRQVEGSIPSRSTNSLEMSS